MSLGFVYFRKVFSRWRRSPVNARPVLAEVVAHIRFRLRIKTTGQLSSIGRFNVVDAVWLKLFRFSFFSFFLQAPYLLKCSVNLR